MDVTSQPNKKGPNNNKTRTSSIQSLLNQHSTPSQFKESKTQRFITKIILVTQRCITKRRIHSKKRF